MASDTLRLWLILNYGGLYLDVDYEFYKDVTWIVNTTDWFAGVLRFNNIMRVSILFFMLRRVMLL